MISKVVKSNGVNCFEVDGKIIDSLAFKSFRPTYKNVGEFYKAGVRIFHVYCSGLESGLKVPYSLFGETWFGDHVYNFDNLDKQIDFFKENAPEGYVFINVHLDSRKWWLEENEGNPNSFTHLSQIACNEKWKKDTADYLRALIKHTEEKYNDFVIGYFLLGGYTTEWFSEFDHEEFHPNKLKAYREYTNNNDIQIPTKDVLELPKDEIFIKDNLEDVVSYRKFHNNLIADTVLYFAKEAQKELNHKKIVGVFFGYILELLYERLWEAGHIEYDKINRSTDIDLLATPSSYQFRGYDDTGAFMLLCDTLEKNGKACFVSFDHTTFLLPTLAENKSRVCGDKDTDIALKHLAEMRARNPKDLLKTREQTISVMRREYMQKTVKRLGYWWFDMFEGWFYDDKLMQEVKKEVELSKEFMDYDKHSVSEVAVFISGESLYKVSKNSEMNTELICNQRGGLGKMGAPYDIFSLNDIDSLDCKNYKLLIFIGAFELNDIQREKINKLKANNRTLLFICPPDYTSRGINGTNDLLEMNLTVSNVKEQKIVVGDYAFEYENAKKDCFFVLDKDVKVLGKYQNSDTNALCVREKNNYNVVFSGVGNLSAEVLRIILNLAKVHVYVDTLEACFVCNNFVGVYSPLCEKTVVHLKEDGDYREIFTDKKYRSKNKTIELDTSKEKAQMLVKIRRC